MTTRIRINIPGSRPIPPVVMRETVEDADLGGPPDDAPPPPPDGPSDQVGPGGSPDHSGDAASRADSGKKTSSWFQPKKPPTVGGDASVDSAPPEAVPVADDAPPPWFQPDTADAPGKAGAYPLPDGNEPPPPPGESGLAGLPPQLVSGPDGPTSGPSSGDMPLPPVPGARGAGGETYTPPGGSMDLSDLLPPPPPSPSDTGTAQMPVVSDPFATGPMPVVSDPFATGPMPVVSEQLATGPAPAEPDPFSSAPEPQRAGPFVPQEPQEPQEPQGPDTPTPSLAAGESGTPKATRKKSKGRSLLKLALAAVVGVGVVAYGAGLLLNPEDVAKGTTVLGHDIGGKGSQEAVNQLDAALDKAASMPLSLLVGEQELELKPSVAGLVIDTEATVRGVSGADYNPLSVIGSLLGAERKVEPVYAVDQEKLAVALEDIAAEAGGGAAPTEGGITFENGQAIAQPGQPGSVLDAASGAKAVEAAFKERAQSGENTVIELPVTTEEPQVDEAEVQRAMEEFAEPAMSGMVTVQAGGAGINFSPEGTLPQFLSMEAVDGKLVDSYDLEALRGLYGSTFDQIQIARADGSVTPVEPEDVVGALRQVLTETDPAQRVGVIDLDPS